MSHIYSVMHCLVVFYLNATNLIFHLLIVKQFLAIIYFIIKDFHQTFSFDYFQLVCIDEGSNTV